MFPHTQERNYIMKFKRLATFFTASLMLGGVLGFVLHQSKKETPLMEVNATSHPGNYDSYFYSGSYYSSITERGEGLNGSLRTALTSYIHPNSVPSYSGSGDTHLSTVLQYADEDPTNSANMVYLYTRDSVKKNAASSWNREHVWPQSLSNNCWGTGKAGADLLHLRPTYNTCNSTRSNAKYKELTNSESTECVYQGITYGRKVNATYFMPLPASKGDVARIIMYVWVAYKNTYSNLPDITSVFNSYDDMMNWHISDRPDVLEGNRNDYAENVSIQKNRNPFVDHPEWAWKIFGQNCSASVLAAAKAAYPEDGTVPEGSVTISSHSASLEVGDTTTLTATSSDGSTISWYTSNENVASISSSSAASGSGITVTAVSAGTATITARITINGTHYSTTCQVTVTQSGGGDVPTPAEEGEYTITKSDLPTTYDTNGEHTSASGLAFVTTNCANYGSFQFKKSGGFLRSNVPLNLKTITITGDSGNKLSVYAGNTSDPNTRITGSNGVFNVQSYSYFKVINQSDSAVQITSITVKADSGSASVDPTISLNKTSLTLEEGLSSQITATAANGTGEVTWEVEDSEIAYLNVTSGNQCVVTGFTAGTTIVTATYSGIHASCTVTVTEPPVSVEYISVSGQKTNYIEGETFSVPTVTAHMSNGTTQNVTSQTTFTGFDKGTLGSQTITATYAGKTESYLINVAHGTLASILISGQTTEYILNDDFEFTGDAFAVMENGYQREIENPDVSSPDMSTTGQKTVTVSCTYFGVTKSTSYTINVSATKSSLQQAYEACEALGDGTTNVVSSSAYTFAGTVTAVVGKSFYLQDGKFGMYVYSTAQTKVTTSTIGKNVSVNVKVRNYYGIIETNSVFNSYITVGTAGKTIEPTIVTSYDSVSGQKQSILSSLTSGVVKEKVSKGTSGSADWKITITVGGQDLTVFAHKSINQMSTLNNVYDQLEVGDYISIDNMVTSVYRNVTQLALTESSVITKGYSLTSFCHEFLGNILCNASGTSMPGFASGYSWDDLGDLFDRLSSSDQNTLKTANADQYGSLAEQVVARYDYIVGKYGAATFANFMNRTISYSNRFDSLELNSNNYLVLLLAISCSVIAVTALVVLKKKKQK